MAIFIIDQFSLNTDLPLDIRYVPGAGRLDPDISVYKYAGMQVFDSSTDTIWYADNSLNWVEVGSGSDASLNDLWSLVVDLSTAITNIDGSIGDLYNITNILDASIGDIYNILSIHDASIGDLTARVILLESSVGYLTNWNNSQDSSIVDLRTDIAQLDASIVRIDGSINNLYLGQAIQDASIVRIDGSINNLYLGQAIQDASIVDLRSDIAQLDASIVRIDGSINDIYGDQLVQDAAIAQLDASIQRIDASLGDYVRKDGDTMSGALTITGGGLVVGTIGNPLDVSIYSDLYVHNNTTIGGNLWVDGSLYVTSVETIDVSAAFIHLNTGLTGTPPASMQSGIAIERGDLEPYVFIYDESNQTFRIGIAANTSTGYLDSSTQTVATREDTPTTNGVAVWNGTEFRFDTSAGFTFDGNILTLDASLYLSQLAGGSNLMLVVTPTGEVIAQTIYNVDSSLNDLYAYNVIQDGSISTNETNIAQLDASIIRIDGSIVNIYNILNIHDGSIGDLYNITNQLDASIVRIDGSINDIYSKLGVDTSVLGAINIGDGSAQVYAGLTADGSLQFRELAGANGVVVAQSGDIITFAIDSSFSGGEVNTASNIGSGEGLSVSKIGVDLPFKSIDTNQPSQVILSSDNSTMYIDVSISTDASLYGLTDVTITEPLDAHQITEWDSDVSKWVNTNNIVWDISLGTTTDDLGGIPAGTDLDGQTLKQILYKILYEYQIPTLSTFTVPTSGTYEKGLISTQFAEVSINWTATNANYPLALLNNVHITKTGAGSIFDASLGLVASDTSVYTDLTGITNWGGTSRTISYNVTIDDNTTESQPAVGSSKSFTFYYRQFWGMVDGNTNANAVNSAMIKGLIDSRLAGESTLNATFDNSTGGFVKYLFAYPDTVASPDNFGVLTQITDQNEFDITGSWDTENEDVSIGLNNVRYRFYLAKNKVNTSTFDINFIF